MGGPAPYWHSFTYDEVGNRATDTRHALSGDTTSTYGTAGHRLDSVTTASPGGTSLAEFAYDETGNTVTRPGQALDWDAEGRLSTVADEDGAETSFVYTADGSRLLRRDPDAVTLYLGGQELRLDRDTNAVSTTRYYTHAGQTVALRTAAGVTWLATDRNGTAGVAVDQNTLQVTQRRHLPFGSPRGVVPSSWPGDRGFLGGPTDVSTGLTHLGAREYDPVLGRFISVDPLLNLADSQQMHGYAYANNSPVTFTDPDGLHLVCGGVQRCAFEGEAWTSNPKKAQQYNDAREAKYGTNPDKAAQETYLNSPILGQSLDPGLYRHFQDKYKYKGSQKFTRLEALEFATINEAAWGIVCQVLEGGAADQCLPDLWGDALVKLAEFVYELTPIPDAVGCIGGSAESCAWLAANAIPGAKLLKGIDNIADAARGARKACKVGRSFVPGTRVLMADGTTTPIEDIEIGDRVLATDPKTGETGARMVTATITSQGHKGLVTLTSSGGGEVVATVNHPFWTRDENRWTEAADLKPGARLLSGQGEVGLRSNQSYTSYLRVYNLTVDGPHTYHVLAGNHPLLVHNAGPCGDPLATQKKGKTERLASAQAADLANYLGFRPTKQIMRGERVFTNGKEFIVQDTTSHIGGVWKIARSPKALSSKSARTATTDALLTEIGG